MGWYGCDDLEGVVVEVEEGSGRGRRLWDVPRYSIVLLGIIWKIVVLLGLWMFL
jgi:hypothetical protein